MAAKMTKPHSPEMIKAQLNGVSEEQYIKEVQKIVAENINDLFYKSNLTMRQFAVQVGISHSSLARILERSGENVRLDTICKIGANIGVPIQDIIISKHQLDANQRKSVEDDIKQLTMHQQQKKQKAYKKKKKYTNLAGQINIFDYLQKIEESKKDKQK